MNQSKDIELEIDVRTNTSIEHATIISIIKVKQACKMSAVLAFANGKEQYVHNWTKRNDTTD